MSYVSVANHRSMALDRVRNDRYARALAAVVDQNSVVLDLGAGTGIHGMIAARLGARRVYLVEPEDVIAVAEESVRSNRLQDIVRCVQGTIENVEIPEPVDVIVSVLTGNFLLSEDLLPVLFHARDRLLKPGGALVPDQATIELAPVSAPLVHAREIAGWSEPQHGVTLAAARPYVANTVHYRWHRTEVSYLAAPQTIHRVDLSTDQYDGLHGRVEFRMQSATTCHGFVGWFTMRLGTEWVSTAPDAEEMHWSPAFLPLDPPVELHAGDTIAVRIDRPPFGEWTWRATWPGGSQRHSTMLAAPLKASTLQKASGDYRPVLNDEGAAVAFVLSECGGTRTASEIAGCVHERWPKRYRTGDEALRLVQSLVKRFA